MSAPVVCALCAEFGARQYRILIFSVSATLVTIEDRLSEPFSNAQVGQWYSVEEGGQFWPIEAPLKTVTLPGDSSFCCKIALPVLFSAHPMVNGLDTFHSPYIGLNNGPVLFSVDEAGLNRSICYEAFVSLSSFNLPPSNQTAAEMTTLTTVRSGSKWSLVRKLDICGPWRELVSPLTSLKVQRNSCSVGSCLLLSAPSTKNEWMLESTDDGRAAQSKSMPSFLDNQPTTTGDHAVTSSEQAEGREDVELPTKLSSESTLSLNNGSSARRECAGGALARSSKSTSNLDKGPTDRREIGVAKQSSNLNLKNTRGESEGRAGDAPRGQSSSKSASNLGNGSAGGEKDASALAQSSKSAPPNWTNPRGTNTTSTKIDSSSKAPLESAKCHTRVLCWKLTSQDAFLIVCSNEQPRFCERIQCNRSFLPSTPKISVGNFYSVEYSRYSTPKSPHVRIFMLNETVSLSESRIVDGELQLRIFMWRAKERYWCEFCEVTQLPNGCPDVCLAWCKLNDKLDKGGLNTLVFVQLIDDLLKIDASSTITNGNGIHRPLDAIGLNQIKNYESGQHFDQRNGSPDSITPEILHSKTLKASKINANQRPVTAPTNGQPKGEEKKLAKVYMQIKRNFHPWIRGPFDQAMYKDGVRIEFKPNSNDIVLSGTDPAQVEKYAVKLRTLRDGQIRRAIERKCRIASELSAAIAKVADDLLAETGAIIVIPTDCTQDKSMEISLLGSAEQIAHVWKSLLDLYGPYDVDELTAETTAKEIGDEKILRCIAAAQQKLHPSGVFGSSRRAETPAGPKGENTNIDNGTMQKGVIADSSLPFSSSHSTGFSPGPSAFGSNGFRSSRATALGSTSSLARSRSRTPSQSLRTSTKISSDATTVAVAPKRVSKTTLAQLRRKRIDYLEWQWRYLVGNGGEALTKMVREVTGNLQQDAFTYDFNELGRIYFSGPSGVVDEVYKKINAKIILLNKNGTIVRDAVTVERQFHCQVIGKGGEFLRKLKRAHGVKEIIVPSEFSNSDQVRIEGPSMFAIRSCKDDLLKLVDDWRNDVYEEVQVQRRLVPMIRGKNSNKIVGLLDGLPKVEVDLPPHGNDDGTGDSLIKIRGHKTEVIIFIERLKTFIDNLEQSHHEKFIPLPLDDPNHSSLEFAKFICAKKRQIERQFPKLNLDFQCDDESAENAHRTVRLNGPIDQVEAVEEIVLKSIESLRQIVVVSRAPSQMLIACDSKHHSEFLRNNGQLLKEIKEKHGRCIINLNKKLQHFEIRCNLKHAGNRSSAMEAVKAHIEKITDALGSKIVHHVLIPARHHRKVCTHLSSLRERFNVRIQMPSKEIDGDPIVVIGPDKESVEATERALRALCPVTEHIEMSVEQRTSFMGRGDAIIQGLIKKHSVKIDVLRADINSNYKVSVSGSPEDVRSCLMEIREHILPVTRCILVSSEIRGSLIGCGGHKVKQICDKYLVKVHFERKGGHCSEVVITGRSANVDECERHILSEIAQYNRNCSVHYDPFVMTNPTTIN